MRRPSALAAALLLSIAACSDDSSTSDETGSARNGDEMASLELPDTPAGDQLGWLLEVTADSGAGLTDDDYEAHFAASFREALTREQFLEDVTGPLSLLSLDPGQTPHHLRGVVRLAGEELAFVLGLEAAHPQQPIEILQLTPTALPPGVLPPPPETWDELDTRLAELAPQVGLTVSEVVEADSPCVGIHEVEAGTARPLASTMKLWVLGALAEQVREGTVSWDDEVTTEAELATLPTGVLQDEPPGTPVAVEDLAQLMISISDNTATDHLISLVSREAVEEQLETFGMASPEMNQPFLTIQESFILELVDYPTLAEEWLGADEAGRRALLDSPEVRDAQPSLDDLSPAVLDEPRWETSWQASPQDVCKALAGLRSLADDAALGTLDQILGLENGGLRLDGAWETTWFKGGSQAGVLTLSYLATHVDGRSFVVSLALADPDRPVGEQAELEGLSLVEGAFTLAAAA